MVDRGGGGPPSYLLTYLPSLSALSPVYSKPRFRSRRVFSIWRHNTCTSPKIDLSKTRLNILFDGTENDGFLLETS